MADTTPAAATLNLNQNTVNQDVTNGALSIPNPAQLWTQSGLLGSYKDTPAHNATLSAVQSGYTGKTDPNSISGNASVQKNLQSNTALSTAASALNAKNGTTQNGTTQNTPVLTKQPVPDPFTNYVDPNLATFQSASNAEISTAQDQVQTQQIQPLTDQHAQTITQLTTDKNKTLQSAGAIYDQNNPHADPNERAAFLASITEAYDTQISDANQNYTTQLMGINSSLNAQIQSIKDTYTQNVTAYKQQQTDNLYKMLDETPITPEMASNPEQIIPYIITAMNSGMTSDEAIAFLSNPSYKEQDLGLKEDTLGVAEENATTNRMKANIAGAAYMLQDKEYKLKYQQAGEQTITKPGAQYKILGETLYNKPGTSEKVLGPEPVDIGGQTYGIGQDIGGGYIAQTDGSLKGPDGIFYTINDNGDLVPKK